MNQSFQANAPPAPTQSRPPPEDSCLLVGHMDEGVVCYQRVRRGPRAGDVDPAGREPHHVAATPPEREEPPYSVGLNVSG